MDKTELNIYIKQIIALIMVYIACMLPLIYSNPKTASMNCNSNYVCKVEMNYVLNLKQSADLIVNRKTKIRFWNGNKYHSGFVNIYDNEDFHSLTINADPFGTADFYVCSDGETAEMNNKMNNDIQRFSDYIKEPKQNFSMSKEYDTTKFNIFGGLITLIFICLSLTKKPITNIFNFLGMLFSKKY